MVSGRCKAYRCAYCGPKKLWLTQMVLAYSMPQRFLTLTHAPAERKRRRDQVANLMRSVRKDGIRCEIAWVTERNPRGTGHHIHALQRGDYIPQSVLQSKWGDRIAHVSKIGSVSEVSAYVIKDMAGSMRAAGYSLKDTDEWNRAHDLNQRVRPVNITRGYFDGRKLEQVRSETKEMLFGEAPSAGDWARVPRRGGDG